MILEFGKFKNRPIDKVYEENVSYCQWLYKQPMIKNYEEVYNFLHNKFHNNNDYYMTFGKYKNKSISWIKENDSKYIYYLKSNEYVQTKLNDLANIVNRLEIN